MLILDEDEDDVEEGLEYNEAMDFEDEPKVESQEGQAIDDEGDPSWTPEEAENAYEQAGNDDCDQKPNQKYSCSVNEYDDLLDKLD